MRKSHGKWLACIIIFALLFQTISGVRGGMVFAETASASYNQVDQASFEPYAGFEAFGGKSTLAYSTEQTHSGQQSLKISDVAKYGGVKLGLKDKNLQPDRTYTVSVWVYQGDGGQISLERLIEHKIEGWQQTAIAAWQVVNSTNDGWVQFKGILSTEGIDFEDTWGIGVTVKAQISAGQSFYIDDFRIEENSGITYQTGFEQYDGFQTLGTSTLTTSTEQVHSGQQSLKVSNVKQYDGVKLNLKDILQPNKSYRASVWVYQGDGGQISFERLIEHKTEGWQQTAIAGWQVVNSTKDGWIQIEGTFSTENIIFSDTWGIGVTVKAQIAQDQSYYIDDFRLDEILNDNQTPSGGFLLDFESADDLLYFHNRSVNGAVFEQSANQAYQNHNSMKVSNRSGRHDGPEINIDAQLIPGKTYSVTAYVYQSSGQTQSMEWNQDGSFLASANIPSGSWTKLSVNYYEAKPSGNTMNIQAWDAVEPKTFDFFVDLFEVREVAAKPIPEPKPQLNLSIPDILPEPTKVGINTFNEHQTINGFGTSYHWYSDMAVKHPYKDELYNLMFEQTNFNIIRLFNMFGYDDGNGGKWGIDSPLDKLDVYKLVEANRTYFDRAEDLQLIICAWSPPAYLKSNDQTSGTGRATLKKGADGKFMYAEYAQYWVDTVNAYKAANMEPTYISLQNELDIEVSYEGMEFAPTETDTMAGYDKALKAVYDALQAAFPGNDYKIIGPESFSAEIGSTTKYTDAISDMNMLDGISHHLYSGGTSDDGDTFVTNFRALKKAFPDQQKLQTEFFTKDPIETAKVINNFFVEEEGDTYIVWELVWNNPGGVISLENPSKTESEWENYHGYNVRDRFYAMNHFSKFIKHGYKRIDSYMNAEDLDLRISSYKSPDESEVVTILINGSGENKNFELDLNGYRVNSSEVYRTSYSTVADNPYERMKNIGTLSEGNTVYMPANSIATVVVKGTPGVNPGLLSPGVPQFFTPPDTYSPREPVYAPNGTPTVDGDFDESVYTGEALEVNMLVDKDEQIISGEGTAKTWLAWDDNNLYAYTDVTDSTSYPGSWDKDNLELFLSETGIRHREYTQADYQYRFNANNATVEGGGGSSQSYLQNVAYKAKAKEDGSGYIIEAKLAFNFGKPYDGKTINFDVQLANDKTGNGRETIVHWSDPKSTTYMDFSRLGYVFLMKKYEKSKFELLKSQLTNIQPHITEFVREDGLIIGGYYDKLADQTVQAGQSVTFKLNVYTTDDTEITYKWQKMDDGKWINIPDADSASLTLNQVSMASDSSQYRCIITSEKDAVVHQAVTSPATLKVLKTNEPDNPTATPTPSTPTPSTTLTPPTTSAPSVKLPLEVSVQSDSKDSIEVKLKLLINTADGLAYVDLRDANFTKLLTLMKEREEAKVIFDLSDADHSMSTTLTLPRTIINQLADEGRSMEIRTSISISTFDSATLKEIIKQAKGESIRFEAKILTSLDLTDAQRTASGERPVYEFQVISGNISILNFGDSKITVEIPYSIPSGELPEAIAVFNLSEAGDIKNEKGKFNVEKGTISFTTSYLSKYVLLAKQVTFQDVSKQEWYYQAVTFLAARDIVKGTSRETFAPNKALSRAEFLVMLMRTFQIAPDVTSMDTFVDAGDKYYSPYLRTAKSHGYVTGTGDNRFDPDRNISREEMIVMLYNFLENTGQLPERSLVTDIRNFADGGSISDYARAKVDYLIKSQVIKGTGNKLNPLQTSSRGEAVQLLFNYLFL